VRLVTYISSSGARAGLLTDEGVIDAAAALGEGGGMSARGVLEADRMADLEAARGEPLADPELLPPVPDPDKIVCIGLNYRSHAEEAGQEPPESPTFFAKFRNALAPPGATVALPQASDKVDYEAEVAMVIGRRAREVSEADALEHVAGTRCSTICRLAICSSPPLSGCRARLRRIGALRPGPRHPGRSRRAGRDRDRAGAERGDDAIGLDRRPGVRDTGAGVPPLVADDPGAG
jgi:hypothetical protein